MLINSIDSVSKIDKELKEEPEIIFEDGNEVLYSPRSCCGRIKNAEKSGFSQLEFLVRNGEKFRQPLVSTFVYVSMKGSVKKIFYNEYKIPLLIGQCVVLEDDGFQVGTVMLLDKPAELKLNDDDKNKLLPKIIRVATDEDLDKMKRLHDEEKDAVRETRNLTRKYDLDMKVTEAQWHFDKQKLTIYFTAPQRVDFREMVKELAKQFKTRIELRQISSREETRRLGTDVGPCGRELCCSTFLKDFEHITLDHAKAQNLSNNLTKLTGNCGRLKCCLKYEYDTYKTEFAKFPPLHSVIEMEEGIGKIIKIDAFRGKITCYIDGLGNYSTIDKETLNDYIEKHKVFMPKNGSHSSKNENENYLN